MSAGTPAGGDRPKQAVVLAGVLRPHGLKGQLQIRCFNEDSRLISPGRKVWLEGREVTGRIVTIVAVNGERIALAGIGDRTAAQAVCGAELSVDRSELPDPAGDEVYLHDLLGFEVVDAGGRKIGTFEGLLMSGSYEYFVIRGAREVLLPLDAPLVGAVDSAARTVRLLVDVDPEEELSESSKA